MKPNQTVAITLCIAVVACAATPPDTIEQNIWLNARIEGLNTYDFPVTAFTDSKLTLSAANAHEKGQMNGYAFVGCNHINFQAALDETSGTMRIDEIYSTRMMCHDDGLENAFLTGLEQINTYTRSEQRVTLYHNDIPIMTLLPNQTANE